MRGRSPAYLSLLASVAGALALVAAGSVSADVSPLPPPILTGADAGGGPHVKGFLPDGTLQLSFFAFDPGFQGGVRVAAGDVNGDGTADIITGAGPGGGPHVKVFDGGTLALLRSFFAYDAGFAGGVFVAAGDVNGDGISDIVTGAGGGAGGHVKAFSGVDSSLVRSFFAFEGSFQGGVRVAAGDVNGDGVVDIVAGAGPGAAPHVKAFDGGTLALLSSFFAYDSGFAGGVYVGSPALPARISGSVYYDANTNGQRDQGETGISGWQVVRNGTDAVTTDGQGAFSYILPYIEQDNVISQLPGLGPWLQTGNLVDQSSVAGGASVTLNPDKSYSVHTVAGSTAGGSGRAETAPRSSTAPISRSSRT
jgi:FG-GAP repeat